MLRRLNTRIAVVATAWALVAVLLGGCDPASLNGPLTGQWTEQTSGYPIAAKPAVGGGTVYLGSWDGNEYAFNEASGAVEWKTYLGVTQAICGGTTYTQGVTSSPWLNGGVAYLGGGGSTWDALDTATVRILWTIPTGDNSVTGGHYNWSSPVVYNGYAYVGIASFCDSPLVQGELLRVNLSTHRIQNLFKVVPDGQVGGSIWTNPVVDASTNTVFVATGNGGGANEPYAESVLALDATTLAVKGVWSMPASDAIPGGDFSTTPVLFTSSTGQPLLAVTNKNGMLYAFQRNDLNAGPVWQTRIAAPDDVCNECAGSFSTGLFDGTRLYYAAGQTTIAGKTVGGSVRALDPDTGAVVWEDALPAEIFGALAGANGMIAVPSSDGGVYIVRAADGTVVYANGLTGAAGASAIFAAPTIADGYLFIGTTDGVVHAFAFPASASGGSAVAHAASVRQTYRTAGCTAGEGHVLTADCRVRVGGAERCTRIGELPPDIGAVLLERLTTRARGPGARVPATVRFYLNGSCAGHHVIRVHLTDGRGTPRGARRWKLPPGAVMSVAASRPLRLDIQMVGRRIPIATAPLAVRPLPAP